MNNITLTLGDRVELGNAIIKKEMEDDAKRNAGMMVQEFVTYRFISREWYGEITDEEFHRILDCKKVPRKVDADLWYAYCMAKE